MPDKDVTLGGNGLKTQAPGTYLLPDLTSTGYDADSSATAYTYGSWVEAIASVSEDLYVLAVLIDGTSVVDGQLQIGVGAGAAEVVQATLGFYSLDASSRETFTFPFPVPIASGVRLALRVADEDAAARDWDVWLLCIAQSDLVSI